MRTSSRTPSQLRYSVAGLRRYGEAIGSSTVECLTILVLGGHEIELALAQVLAAEEPTRKREAAPINRIGIRFGEICLQASERKESVISTSTTRFNLLTNRGLRTATYD